MKQVDSIFLYTYREGIAKLVSPIGVKNPENPGKAFWWVGYVHFGMSMLLTLLLTGMAIGDLIYGEQIKLNWSESPVILFSCFIFFLFWPMYAVGRVGVNFYSFLREHHTGNLDASNSDWSVWVGKLTKPRMGVILPFVLLFFVALVGYVSEGQGWWLYTKFPIIGLVFAYQGYYLWEVRKFQDFIRGEMELLKG